jgi:hypothetical protein
MKILENFYLPLIIPLVFFALPVKRETKVVFPAPEGPMIAHVLPCDNFPISF